MWTKTVATIFGISNLLIVPTDSHFFWLNVDKVAGEIEVTFSEKAGVPDGAINNLEEKIQDNFALFAMYLGEGEGKRPTRKSIEWHLENDRIVGAIADYDPSSSSIIVSGQLDFGPFSEYGIDVDDLQQHFFSDQLLNKDTPMKIPAHGHMREKPFYVELVGCNSEIAATIHGLSTSIDEAPLSICFYELGGQEIACQDVDAKDDDAAVAKIPTSLEIATTIFAKVHATFPSEGGKGSRKYATVSDNYEPQCSY